jgi:DNA processing protein
MDEQTAQLLLLHAPALSAALYSTLIEQHGSALAALQAGAAAWRDAHLAPRCCAFLIAADPTTLSDERRWLDGGAHHHLVMLDSPLYPALLKQLQDAPLGLFVKGNPEVLRTPQLAMVGSRNPTPYGRELAEAFAKHLGCCGLSITSGLAAGIDAASHRGALAGGGLTLAVCGTGLDSVYPRSSEPLAATALSVACRWAP